jgi:hypothetical protein
MLWVRPRFRRCPGSGDLEIVAYKRSSCVPDRGDARGWADGRAERRREARRGSIVGLRPPRRGALPAAPSTTGNPHCPS